MSMLTLGNNVVTLSLLSSHIVTLSLTVIVIVSYLDDRLINLLINI